MDPHLHLLTDKQGQSLVEEERNRRRIARLVQVRHQSKEHAKEVREKVKAEKEVKLRSIQHSLKNQLEARRDERIRRLNLQLSWSMKACGSAQERAESQVEEAEKQKAKQRDTIRHTRQRHKSALESELVAQQSLCAKPPLKKKESSLMRGPPPRKTPQRTSAPVVRKYPFEGGSAYAIHT